MSSECKRAIACDHAEAQYGEEFERLANLLPEGWCAVLIPPDNHAGAALSKRHDLDSEEPMNRQEAFAVSVIMLHHDDAFVDSVIAATGGSSEEPIH